MIFFSRTYDNRRPVGFVGAVGVVLCFEADRSTLVVNDTFLSAYGSVEEVTCVYLNTRFVGIYFQCDSGFGRRQSGSYLRDVTLGVEHPVVVVSVAVLQLDEVVVVDILPTAFGVVKSIGVSLTGAISPVVMKVLSTGV